MDHLQVRQSGLEYALVLVEEWICRLEKGESVATVGER